MSTDSGTVYQSTAFDGRKDKISISQAVEYEPVLLKQNSENRSSAYDTAKITDFACLSSVDELDCLRQGTLDNLGLQLQRKFYGFSQCDSINLTGCLLILVGFVMLGAALGALVIFVVGWYQRSEYLFEYANVIIGVLLGYKLWGYVSLSIADKRKHAYPRPDDTHFDRATGMLVLKEKGNKIELPFKELEACYYKRPTKSGSLMFSLYLRHKDSGNGYTVGNEYTICRLTVKLAWLLQFMDISKPLPDTPLLSAVRHLDPTTVEKEGHDTVKKEFWCSLSEKQFSELANASEQKLKDLCGNI
jgi:hypothetical protein